jgi:hypothetical protein
MINCAGGFFEGRRSISTSALPVLIVTASRECLLSVGPMFDEALLRAYSGSFILCRNAL